MRQYSNKQESRIAYELDMKKQPNSGATVFLKGDVIDEYSVLECKTRANKADKHTLKQEWFDGTKQEAFSMGRGFYGVVFDFGDGIDFVCIESRTYHTLATLAFEREDILINIANLPTLKKSQTNYTMHKRDLRQPQIQADFTVFNFSFIEHSQVNVNNKYIVIPLVNYKTLYRIYKEHMKEEQ